MNLLVTGIGELLTMVDGAAGRLGIVHDAAVYIHGGRVAFAGRAVDLPAVASDVPRLDAESALVTPGLVEPHAHPIFAGSRAAEFDLRARGRSYAEIQAAGGGILSTVRATRAAGDDQLLAGLRERLARFLAHGVTIVEAKSGYELTTEGELRLLGLIGAARRSGAVELSPTLLAHVVAPEAERSQYLHRFAAELIPAASQMAEALDVYCDQGAFTLDETRLLLEAGRRAGLALQVHAEQFTRTGAAELAAEMGARAASHLEQLGAAAPAALARAGTVCVLLPGAALTLKLPWPDARRLIAAGCTVALGTDCNPGSSLTESLPLMMTLACTQMGMTCEEAWIGVTRASARALGRPDAGHLEPGARGDLVVWQAGDYCELVQHYGVPLARQVVIAGRIVWSRAIEV